MVITSISPSTVQKIRRSADVYEVPVLGGSPKLVLKDVMNGFAISPDGKKIAFIRDGTLRTANIDGTGLRLLAEGTEIPIRSK